MSKKPRKHFPDQIKVGNYRLGAFNVDLIALPHGTGGEFYFCPDDASIPRIKVGLAYDNWDEVVATLLHEAMEMALCSVNRRYLHSGKMTGDASGYIFVFSHDEFGQACGTAACFITPALPELASWWRKVKGAKE
jgi:hypothetical protein